MDEAAQISNELKAYYAQYNRFEVLYDIGNHFGNSGVKCGIPELIDYMDMNCGAIPEGSFPEIIDFSAATQFLRLYTQIAESRFAYAVSQIINSFPQSINEMRQFMYSVGEVNKMPDINTPRNALEVYETVVLDGLPGDNPKKIIEETDTKIVWTNTVETHKQYWDKARTDLSVYYELIQSFVNGILDGTGMQLIVENNSKFTVSKQEK